MIPLVGPEFGSYPAGDVTWLLKDLSAVALEAPTEEREAAVQAGTAHYAESLPIEYQPSAEYQDLFRAALADSADRVAHAVGVVTELVLARAGRTAGAGSAGAGSAGGTPVLVSLARAGTPIGILMRRWAAAVHGLDLPHYTVSIVRGRGIDRLALRWLAARHAPSDVAFVDGWTGKGAITRELAAAVAGVARDDGLQFDPALAVLADPGGCVPLFGTRDDFLIPSACLNSTVSGLVSRTVLNDAYIGSDDFHGAKYYRELTPSDVSMIFIDAICARFPAVADRVAADWPRLAAGGGEPDWRGWRACDEVAARYGITDVNLVKPGVGETTRVLLRRVPWKVLIRAGSADLAHVLLLARQRGVDVVDVPDLPYSCVGLIRPGYSGAAGPLQAAAAP